MNQKILRTRFFLFLFFIFQLFIASVNAQGTRLPESTAQNAAATQASAPEKIPANNTPGLAEIIPLAGRLSSRLTILKREASSLLDVNEIENTYSTIERKLGSQTVRLDGLKNSENNIYSDLVALNQNIDQDAESFDRVSRTLVQAIQQLEAWRQEWLEERNRWTLWRSSLFPKEDVGPLESTFETAENTIDTALGIIHPQLEKMLQLQKEAVGLDAEYFALKSESDGLIEKIRLRDFSDEYPPMFSPRYFTQLRSGMGDPLRQSFERIRWPDNSFFLRVGWIMLIQIFITLFVITIVFKKRSTLEKSTHLRLLVKRPFSAGLFMGYMTTISIYSYVGSQTAWRLVMAAVVIISFVRIVTGFVQTRWKRQFIYWISIFLLSDTWLEGLGIPIPLFRLYIFLMALASILLYLQWSRESSRSGQTGFIRWALRSGALFFAFVLITETWGKTRLLIPLCISLILTISFILVFMMLLYILHGFIELALRSTAIPRKIRLYEEEIDIAVRRTVQFMHVVIWGFVLLPATLVIWGAHSNLKDALTGMLSLGFNLGEFRVSVNLLLIAAGVLYGSFFLSWILRKMLMDNLLLRSRAEMGVRNAIGQLLHYFIVLVAFLLAISLIGFDITKLTIIMSAFGVGIGFGLQSIVNNFVSGLILLFERPIRVGDSIELDGQWAEIKRIGLRATAVQTFDQADVIIPNADLITQRVTNWTLTSRQVRLIVPVGVAYGSDVPLVVEKLTACGRANKMVAETPPPQVLFLSFGESSLDFELRVWVQAENRLNVRNDLHREIEKNFREANIEIAFPQRDLHIRSIDESIALRAGETPAG